jgi:hypothetical protein
MFDESSLSLDLRMCTFSSRLKTVPTAVQGVNFCAGYRYVIDSKSFFDPEKFFRSSGNSVPRAARALFGGWHNRRPGEDQALCGKLLN